MALKQVVGPFPITFVSEDTTHAATLGMQQQIPLSLIQYDQTAATPVTILNWTGTTADLAVASGIVVGLIQQGVLSTVG